ncbi:BadF/BadG/BcrA/BcrD ATPase family protein [Actinacidiphila rubida]|uniref:BadF-type ATPase n=1 Tax=Actinacidiphila rubida TaxID=310780 RepID=A0A1H8ENF1_9ACTN|nr:BadF/BadG/BcrA/BcrD ATPase family protein [Actinacidiphila rubida]SEN20407.1 BadF-type ATPase [Actinacidiphila rubida]
MNARMRFAIDGGGTTTRLAIAGPYASTAEPVVLGSMNPASVRRDEAVALLRSAIHQVSEYALKNDDAAVDGVIASAAISRHTIGSWAALLAEVLNEHRVTGDVVLTNDIDGLALAPPVGGCGGVLVAGTGSGALVVTEDGRSHRIGGWEYLASDEGSAFWLGRRALAAAVRAADGRGQPTAMVARIEARIGGSLGDVTRQVAELPHPRQVVADLARCVTAAWLEDRDAVATELVHAALDELVLLTTVGARRAGGAQRTWALTGGLVIECDAFAHALTNRLETTAPETDVHVVAEPVCALLDSPTTTGHWPGLVRRIVTART